MPSVEKFSADRTGSGFRNSQYDKKRIKNGVQKLISINLIPTNYEDFYTSFYPKI